MATGMTNSINLTWEHPERSTGAVSSYEINVKYTINQCGGETYHIIPPIILGSSQHYKIISAEEDSSYNISLIAINSVTRSVPAIINAVMTQPASISNN